MSLALTGNNILTQYNTNRLQSQVTSQQSKIHSQQSKIQDQQQELQKYQTKVQEQQHQIQGQGSTIQIQNQKLQDEIDKFSKVQPHRSKINLNNIKQQAIQAYKANQISTQIPTLSAMTMSLNHLA